MSATLTASASNTVLKNLAIVLLVFFASVLIITAIYFALSSMSSHDDINMVFEEDRKSATKAFTIVGVIATAGLIVGSGLLYLGLMRSTHRSTLESVDLLKKADKGPPRMIICRHDIPGYLETCEEIPAGDEEILTSVYVDGYLGKHTNLYQLQSCFSKDFKVAVVNARARKEGEAYQPILITQYCQKDEMEAKIRRLQAYERLMSDASIIPCKDTVPENEKEYYTVFKVWERSKSGPVSKIVCPDTEDENVLRQAMQKYIFSSGNVDYRFGYFQTHVESESAYYYIWQPANLLNLATDNNAFEREDIKNMTEAYQSVM